MAWTAEDTFNSYSAGDLSTLNGGSGFSAGWVATSGTISVAAGASAFEGSYGVTSAASAAALYYRTLTSTVTAGTVYVHMKSSSTSSVFYFILRDGASGKMYIKFDSDGNIKIFSNGAGAYITLSAYVVDTWYEIAVDFDTGTNANSYRASVNGGTYSSYYTVSGGTFTSISAVALERDNTAGVVYWDYVTPTATSLTTGLVSYWKLDESSGNASDSVGSNTLTNNNSTAFVAGKINNGADLESASSNYFSIIDASQSGLDITGNISFSLWFKPESQIEGYLISKWGTAAANQRSYNLLYSTDAGGTIYFNVNPTGIDAATGQASWATTLSNASWYHIAVSWVASTSTATLHINGTSIGTDNTGAVTSIFNGDRAFNIGGDTNLGAYQDGIVDEVGIWNRAITADEVTELYNSGNGNQYPFTSTNSGAGFFNFM